MTGEMTGRRNVAGVRFIAIMLLVIGLVCTAGAYSASHFFRESYEYCLEDIPGGVSEAENALEGADRIPYPFGIACTWDMADGTTLNYPIYFGASSGFFVIGLGMMVAFVVLMARSFLPRRSRESMGQATR